MREASAVLIIGAGLTGLMCARELQQRDVDYQIVEREARIGGLTRTMHLSGFHFDHTGHFLHLKTPEMRAFVESLPIDWRTIERRSAIHVGDKFVPFPFQFALYHLPDEIRRECLMGAIEAYRRSSAALPENASFLDWILHTQGAGIAKWFMVPYNTKLYDFPLDRLGTDWMGRFMPRVDIDGIVDGCLRDRSVDAVGYNARFLYPASGGIEALPRAIAATLDASRLRCDAAVVGLDGESRSALLRDGSTIRYARLVSSMPLPALATITTDLPADLRHAAETLKANTVYAVLLGWRGRANTDLHWVYVPDDGTPFYRVGFPTNVVASAGPRDSVSAYVEMARYEEAGDAACDEHELISGATDLVQKKLGLVGTDAVLEVGRVIRIAPAYVLYDAERAEAVASLTAWYRAQDVETVGRYGRWTYSSMEDALVDGRDAANAIAR